MLRSVIRVIAKIIYAILVFVLALFLSDRLMNRESADMTSEMGHATFPLIYAVRDGQRINCMRGTILETDYPLVCDFVTPVDAATRRVELQIDTYSNHIENVSYEVRDTSGERLIENGDVTDISMGSELATLGIALKDLLLTEEEYILRVSVKCTGKDLIYFDTRIKLCEDISKADEMITFALDFSDKTFDKEEARTLTTYLESNEEGDNTTFAKVNIHSSFSQITWGSLAVQRTEDPQIYVNRINPYVGCVCLTYPLDLNNSMSDEKYNIREYYYVRFGTERMYLLDYERTMDSVFRPRGNVYSNNKISLGITDPDALQIVESPDGNMLSFVKENALYLIDTDQNKTAVVFSFYDEENNDPRDVYDGCGIRILSVDENGNIRFLVRGYMNRGIHEGSVGIACYYYNSMLNTVEEEIYIPVYTSAGYLKAEAGKLAYANSSNKLFILLAGKLYKIDLMEKTSEVVEENMMYGSYQVSSDRHLVAWTDTTSSDTQTVMYLQNLSTGRRMQITDEAGGSLKPLGFLGEDLVYGICYENSPREDEMGTSVYPMRKICIMSESGEILKTYEKPDVYVTEVTVLDNQIQMKRAAVSQNGRLTSLEDDYIMNDGTEGDAKNLIEVVATQNLEKITQIAVGATFSSSKVKVLTPRQVLYEGNRQLFLTKSGESRPYYFVYNVHGLCGMHLKEKDAIREAELLSGSVVDENGKRIWEKSDRSRVFQIDSIKPASAGEGKNSIAVCLEAMLEKEGISIDAARLMERGETVRSILEKQMPEGRILELGGCSLESVLVFVGRGIPVMAMLGDGTAVLIVGYNELNTIILNPASGKISKMGMNDSAAFFEANGNRFIAYVTDE